jgi:transcriptional regulator with PAS, ATPase and Fis domain
MKGTIDCEEFNMRKDGPRKSNPRSENATWSALKKKLDYYNRRIGSLSSHKKMMDVLEQFSILDYLIRNKESDPSNVYAQIDLDQPAEKIRLDFKRISAEIEERRRSAVRTAVRTEAEEMLIFIDTFEENLVALFRESAGEVPFSDEELCIAECDHSNECFLNFFLSFTNNEWFWYKDPSLNYVYGNSVTLTNLKVSLSKLRESSDEDFYDADAVERLRSLYQAVIEGASVFQVHSRTVLEVPKIFLDVLFPIRSNEELLYVAGVSRDVTDLYLREILPAGLKSEMRSEAMIKIRERCEEAAQTDLSILLLGETGVGKDHMARFIHEHSKRPHGPFITLNMAAFPKDLLESELFGYEKGGHNQADTPKQGLIELADGGTLVINEIGELPPDMQAKLLTFLDSKSFYKIGGTKPIRVDVRLITATNKPLGQAVEDGTFRRDLYYRLNGIAIEIPPLRDHLDDLPVLIPRLKTRIESEDPN